MPAGEGGQSQAAISHVLADTVHKRDNAGISIPNAALRDNSGPFESMQFQASKFTQADRHPPQRGRLLLWAPQPLPLPLPLHLHLPLLLHLHLPSP